MRAVLWSGFKKGRWSYRNTKVKNNKCETNINDIRNTIGIVPRIYKELLKNNKKSIVQDKGNQYRQFIEAQPDF